MSVTVEDIYREFRRGGGDDNRDGCWTIGYRTAVEIGELFTLDWKGTEPLVLLGHPVDFRVGEGLIFV